MGNSTIRVQDVVDYAQTFPEVLAVLPTVGYSLKKVYTIMDAVMSKFLAPSLKWTFNRQEKAPFYTNSWQQDYATNTVDVGFLQDGTLLEINNTANPKPIWPLEVVQNLPQSSQQFGRPGQVCTYLNKNLRYAVWGAANIAGTTNGPNPQPLQVIANMVGVNQTPANPWLQVQDTLGNFWAVTGFGTTGSVNPFANYSFTLTSVANASGGNSVYSGTITGGAANALVGLTVQVSGFNTAANNGIFLCVASSATTITLNNAAGVLDTHAATLISPPTPVFPTFTAPNTVATTATDGSVVWTAINPNAFGFRVSPLPPQTGVPYQAWIVYQMRQVRFGLAGGLGMGQVIDPVPDDYAGFFMDGFVAHCLKMNPDPKIRAKHADAVIEWEKSLKEARMAQDRTRDSAIMFPSQGIMDSGCNDYPSPAYPYGPN